MFFFKKPDLKYVHKLEEKKDVQGLIRILNLNLENEIGRQAAYALGRLGNLKAVDPLINALKSNDRYTRGIAAYELGNIGDNRALLPLTTALVDESDQVIESAKSALKKLHERGVIDEASLQQALKNKKYYVSSIDFTGRTVRDAGRYLPAEHPNCPKSYTHRHLAKGSIFPACPNCRRAISWQLSTYDLGRSGEEYDSY